MEHTRGIIKNPPIFCYGIITKRYGIGKDSFWSLLPERYTMSCALEKQGMEDESK
jgi:hypothetical protein